MLFRSKGLPIGIENFKKLIDKNVYYVDKSKLIEDLINEEVILYTRPRRFGKTLNMSMLYYFFSIKQKENAYLFDDLEISKNIEVMRYQNQYPVIFITLKDMKSKRFNDQIAIFSKIVRNLINDNLELLNSDNLEEIDKEIQQQLNDTIIAHYSDYLIESNTFEGQTAIVSAQAIEENLQEFLFLLKQMNMRFILLLKSPRQEETKIALQLGIYDIVFGNFYASQIKDILEHPKRFRDIADLYRKTFHIDLKIQKRIRNQKTNSFFSRK